jgi:signal transduction histidine kinase
VVKALWKRLRGGEPVPVAATTSAGTGTESLRREAERGRRLVEESREFVLVLDDDERVVAASARAREALEGVVVGSRLSDEMLASGSTRVPFRVPYDVGGRTETLLYLGDPGDLAAYEELRAGFTAAVSHELRTPLASMRVLVDGLLADAHLDQTKTRDYLHLLASENARLTRLIENFLTFSRLERGRERFAFAAVSPSTLVNGAIAAIRERVPADCELTLEIAPDLPPVRADEGAVVSALINLLDNALKYTPDEKRVLVKVTRTPDGIAFDVQDNGIGIAPREYRRIFKRFYRVDQRLASATSGVGLGLSIVELIARAHGGSVTVRSTEGAGSTFTLRLPYASELKGVKGRPEGRPLPTGEASA